MSTSEMEATESGELRADIRVSRPDFDVAARFEVAAGRSLAILGPNGAGKSTLLAALAGMLRLDDGEVVVDGVLLERAGGPRLRPENRRITLLDQKPRLFPHLSAEQNIAFAPRSQGSGRALSRRIAHDWLERIGLADRAGAKAHELSGGEQQRVAIARALAAAPRVLLLDEPFAALDAHSAPAVRRMLARELKRIGVTSVLVTHDLADAWQWADRCLVLERGQVVEDASPHDIAARPGRRFTAALAGLCVIEGTRTAEGLELGDGHLAGVAEGRLVAGQRAFGVVAPCDVKVSSRAGEIRLTVDAVSMRAGTVRLEHTSGLAAELTVSDSLVLANGRLPAPGDTLWFSPQGLRVLGDGRLGTSQDG